jgi:O-antigen ligase
MTTTTVPTLNPQRPAQFATVVMFLLPLLALGSSSGMSVAQLVILLTCAWYARRGVGRFYAAHLAPLAWILAAFGGYFLVSLGRMLATQQGGQMLDGPSRLLLALSCIGFVAVLRPSIRYFWLGLCCAAIATGLHALLQRLVLGMDRAVGFTHHAITYGDIALALGVMALGAVSEFRASRLAWLPPLALLSGLTGSVLSESRGGWLALVLVAAVLLRYGRAVHGRRIFYGLALMLLLVLLAYAVPATGVAQRVALAGSDVQNYVHHADATTSVGIRLELWKASWLMFTEHPLLGVGRDDFHPALQALAQQGLVQQSPALAFSSSHNDVLNALATGGLLDGAFLLLMYGAPLAFFVAVLRQPAHPQRSAALAGLILVACFIAFGLTDVMFWLMATKVFYAMMVGVLVGFCLSGKPAAVAAPTPAVPVI